MNMISTGSFLTEMDASNKQETLAEKFAAVWEKKNTKAARAGGVSLMALSLAACGSSSDDDTAAAPVEPTTPTTPTTPVVVAKSHVLATTRDILSGSDFTTLADSITATATTLTGLDVIAEGNAGDGDTLTVNLDSAHSVAPASITGIENIVFNVSSFSAQTIEAANIIGGTITVNNTQLGGGTAADVDDVAATTNVTLGTGVTTASTIDVVTGYTGTINAGTAAELLITFAAGADQVSNVTVNGDILLDVAVATDLNITATAASDVTFDSATSTGVDTITGNANTTLVADADLSDFDGLTITGAAAISGNGATADLTGVAVPVIVTGTATADLTVASGVNITSSVRNTQIDLTADDDADATTANEFTATIVSDAVTTTAGDLTISLTDSATGDGFTTLNLIVNEDANANSGDIDITGGATLDETINVSGAGDADIALTAGAAGDMTLNAAAMTGALTMVAGASLVSLTGGSGDDSITLAANGTVEADLVVAGGSGNDTLTADGGGSDIADMTVSGFEIISGAFTGLASQFSGATYVVASGSAININSAGTDVDLASINLSTLTFAAAADVVTVDLAGGRDASVLLAGTEFVYVGGSAQDDVTGSANDDNISGNGGTDDINGGAGDDVIDGGAAADVITGGTGADTLTGGAAADVFVYTTADHSTATSMDVIKDFSAATTFDLLSFDTTGDAHTVSDAVVTDAAAFTNGILTNATVVAAIAADTTLAAAITEFLAVADFDDNDVGGFIWQGNTYVVHADADNAAGNIVCLEGVELASIVEATSGGNSIDQFTGTIA